MVHEDVNPDRTDSYGRIAVVNLDESWPFRDLVRRLALDTFSDSRLGRVSFRDIGEPGVNDHSKTQKIIWGARWPITYSGDSLSIFGDLLDDLSDLRSNQISWLAIIFVLPDTHCDRKSLVDAQSVIFRFAKTVIDDPGLLARIHRWAVRRDHRGQKMSDETQRLAQDLMSNQPDAERGSGTHAIDHLALLHPPPVGTPDELVVSNQFMTLRCLTELVAAGLQGYDVTSSSPSRLTSPADELVTWLRGRTIGYSLRLSSPGSTSERLALLLSRFRSMATAQQPDLSPPSAETSNAVSVGDVQVDEILELMDPSTLLGGMPIETIRDKELGNFEQLKQLTYWTRENENKIKKELTTDEDDLQRRSSGKAKNYIDYRNTQFARDLLERDYDVRRAIRNLRLTNAGLSGEARERISRIRRGIASRRDAVRVDAAKCRESFGFALVESAEPQPRDTGSHRSFAHITLSALQDYEKYRTQKNDLETAVRLLPPRIYGFLGPAMVAMTLAVSATTIFGTGLARSLVTDGTFSGWINAVFAAFLGHYVTILAWIGASVIGLILLKRSTDKLTAEYRRIWNQFLGCRERIDEQINTVLKNALRYVIFSRTLIWLDLIEIELDVRTSENDIDAFSASLAQIRPTMERMARVNLDDKEAEQFFQRYEDTVNRFPVSLWLPNILEKVDSALEFGTTTVSFKGMSDGTFSLAGEGYAIPTSAFLGAIEVDCIDMGQSRVIPDTPADTPDHSATGDAASPGRRHD